MNMMKHLANKLNDIDKIDDTDDYADEFNGKESFKLLLSLTSRSNWAKPSICQAQHGKRSNNRITVWYGS